MKHLCISLMLSAACLSASAAAETETLPADTSRAVDLDEVIVVSQPKEVRRLRQQPLSSTVVSAAEMESLHARDLRSLSAYVPSFVMPDYGSRYTSAIYVRGIGSRINSPAVGLYVDGLPVMSKSQLNFHSYETTRADVLRGPQGTLYGINTEGGLLRIYTKNPLEYQGTNVRLGIGSHFYRNAEAAHYRKLGSKAGISVAAFYEGGNGFFHNHTTGSRADDYNEAGGRIRLAWQPTSKLTIDAIADYQWTRQSAFPYGVFSIEDNNVATPSANAENSYHRNILTLGTTVKYAARHFDFYSATSWQHLHDGMKMDIDYLPYSYMRMEQRQLQNALTQEFTLRSRGERRWQWTAGIFGSYQWLKTNAPVYFDDDMDAVLSATVSRSVYNAMLSSMSARMGETAAAAIERAGGVYVDMGLEPVEGLFHTPTANVGLFHESTIRLTPRLTATLGLRWDVSHVAVDYATSAAAAIIANVMGTKANYRVETWLDRHESETYNQLLPKLGLSWLIDSRGSNIYASVAKGYRAGGYNIQMFSDILQAEIQTAAKSARGSVIVEHGDDYYQGISNTISYKPETSWNYELGAHLNLGDGRTRLDLAAFFMQVRNQQLSVMASAYGFGRMMVNAGKSYSCGVEASIRSAAFNDRLRWAINYAYVHAAFKEYNDTLTTGEAVSYEKKRVPYVPLHTLGAMADYSFHFTGIMRRLTIGANVSAMGNIYWDEANTYSQKFYALLGAHATADFGAVNVDLWARNITNTRYNTFALYNTSTNSYFAQRGRPFQMGVDVKIHF